MNKTKSFIFMAEVFFFSFLLISFSYCSLANAEDLDIVIDDWPPYIDPTLPTQGFMSEIVLKSFEKVGINAKLIYKP